MLRGEAGARTRCSLVAAFAGAMSLGFSGCAPCEGSGIVGMWLETGYRPGRLPVLLSISETCELSDNRYGYWYGEYDTGIGSLMTVDYPDELWPYGNHVTIQGDAVSFPRSGDVDTGDGEWEGTLKGDLLYLYELSDAHEPTVCQRLGSNEGARVSIVGGNAGAQPEPASIPANND